MNEVEKRSNLLGVILLLLIYTPLGILLSFFYVIFQTTVHHVWANIIAAFVMGCVLAAIVWLIKRLLKVTSTFMPLVIIAIGTAAILYVMWSMWFVVMFEMLVLGREGLGVSDFGFVLAETRDMIFVNPEFMDFLRLFNYHGTWHINYNVWTGPMLAAVWVGEVAIIAIFPLLAAYAAAGLFITELNSWVEERLMNYGFSAFDDHELDRIASGDIDAIIDKPLEARNGPMSAVAVCYLKGEATDFIAIYKASWDKEGVLSKGRHVMTVQLGAEKIDALDAGLQAKHYPVAEREKPQANPVEDDGDGGDDDGDGEAYTFGAATNKPDSPWENVDSTTSIDIPIEPDDAADAAETIVETITDLFS